jgi:succinoglycan biosynthesis protein ExoM
MHVAVCCITFRRPEGLRRLLDGLNRLTFTRTPEPRVTVVVIDNDDGAPMRALVDSHRATCRWSLIYDCEPLQGLANARNRSLDHVPPDADYVAFIDDDEVPEPVWLDELLHVARTYAAPIVQGPVLPALPEHAPAWLRRGRFFEQGPYQDGVDLHFASTNNCLIELAVMRRLGLRFDARFNRTGGEDQHFFGCAIKAGQRVVTAEKALVRESIPESRATLGYLLRRRFRMGNTLAMIDRIEGGPALLTKRVIKSGGRLTLGLAQSVILPLAQGRAGIAKGLCNAAWGAGALAGLFGVLHHEY